MRRAERGLVAEHKERGANVTVDRAQRRANRCRAPRPVCALDAGKRQVRHHPPHGLCACADHDQRLRRARFNRRERGAAHQRLTVDDDELLGLSEPTGFARGEQNHRMPGCAHAEFTIFCSSAAMASAIASGPLHRAAAPAAHAAVHEARRAPTRPTAPATRRDAPAAPGVPRTAPPRRPAHAAPRDRRRQRVITSAASKRSPESSRSAAAGRRGSTRSTCPMRSGASRASRASATMYSAERLADPTRGRLGPGAEHQYLWAGWIVTSPPSSSRARAHRGRA